MQERLKNEKVEIKYGPNMSDTILLNWETIAQKIFSMLYHDSDFVRLPFLINEAYKRNYQPFLNEFDYTNTELNLRFADSMFLSIICAEEIHLDWNDNAEISNTFLADIVYKQRLIACENWPVRDISDQYKTPIKSDIPTLIFSGNLDPVTPPQTGNDISKKLTNSEHITIPYMGHMFSELTNSECYDNYVVAFYEQRENELNANCFDNMKPPPFQTTANKK